MKLYNPIPPIWVPSASRIRLPHLAFLSIIFLQYTQALSYPTAIEIDLVFPLPNKTYPNISSFPVIFALQNVPAANEFGYTLSWDLRLEDTNSTVALGSLYKMTYRNTSDSGFLLDDGNVAILPDNVHNGTRLKSGAYSLHWKYGMVTCRQTGDRTTYNIAGTQASNAHSFRIEEGGVDERGIQLALDKECPAFGDLVVAKDVTKGGCPIMAGSRAEEEEKRDPCRARLSAKQASCIQGNVTGDHNETLCSAAFRSGGEKDAGESGASSTARISGLLGLGVGLVGVLVLW